MENKNLTAVEWLFRWVNDNPEATHKEYSEAFEQAKQMEKEQLENARPQIVSNCVIKEISDEEIWNASIKYDNGAMLETPMVHFQQGAFWYRKQLKNGVHGT